MLTVAVDADALELAQFGCLAGHALESREQLPFLGVGGHAQLIDGVADPTRFGLFTRGSTQRAPTEQQQRDAREAAKKRRTNPAFGLSLRNRRRECANQSAAFGGGPI